ncbi:MAG: rhamnogalacturonan acetylesterase [Planctomycetes bacterium]|nr:rhamnogalacturonan acetylesterase [Planctomycetota bacterium]
MLSGVLLTGVVVVGSVLGLGGCSPQSAKTDQPPEEAEPKSASGQKDGASSSKAADRTLRFDFGPGPVESGYTQILATTLFTRDLGYGFEKGAKVTGVDRGDADALRRDFCTSNQPFFFSVAVPEGNYNVTVILGDRMKESTTTVKAELRRLMLEKVHTAAGQWAARTFTVNVRTPRIAGGGEVRLKGREKTTEWWDWDDKLTLEFSNTRPCVCGLEVAKAEDAVTVFLLGDSTVCDQPGEPYTSWGQMLPRFFRPGVAVANHAESGESLRSSLSAGRLAKVASAIRPGDYLFIQYGHNDEKEHGSGIGAFGNYQTELKQFVREARRHGATPVLVTPMHRRTFDASGRITNSHGDYPEAMRQVAREEKVPLVDLLAMSQRFYEALGPEKSAAAFKSGDRTHHSAYGAYELARCIVEGIKQNKLDLTKYLADDVPPFDPSHPDSPADFQVPVSPGVASAAPLGS